MGQYDFAEIVMPDYRDYPYISFYSDNRNDVTNSAVEVMVKITYQGQDAAPIELPFYITISDPC